MVDERDKDDIDSVFETDNELQENNISESNDDVESDADLIDSYMSTDDDYNEPIENHIEEKKSEDNDNMDLLIDEETSDGVESENTEEPIQSAEDYMQDLQDDNDEDLDLINEEEDGTDDVSKSDDNTNEETTEDVSDNEDTTDIESDEIPNNSIESDKHSESEEEILNSMVEPEVEKVEEKEKENVKEITTSPLDLNDEDDDFVPEEDEEDVVSEKSYSVNSTNGVKAPETPMQSFNDFKRESFWKEVRDYQDKYSEDALNTYLERFQNEEDNKHVINEYYSQIIIKYGEYINFGADEEARHYAWLIAAGKFADLIERRKEMGIIKSDIKVNNLGKKELDVTTDPNIEAVMSERKATADRVGKYAIDRTVFAIADDSAEEISPFEDKKAVDKEFYEGPFYKILKEVMASDRFADMSKVYMKIIINPDTSFIPIADFSTGVRFVCIDTNDVDQYRIHALALARQIPFSFQGKRRNEIKTRVLYSDMCINRPIATVSAIKKLVAFEYWNKKRIITLQNNFAIAYTTENQYVEMFERGDPDSKNPENCVNITRKPKTCSIGIIALDKKSVRDRQALRRRQGKKILQRMANGGWYNDDEDVNVNDYNIHFILSADIIANDRDLVNPAIAPQDRCVHYQITRYCESNPVIILDGLQTICTCIVKEHFKKYGHSTKYSIEFEYDPTELLTPGVMGMIDSHDGIEESTYKRSNPMSIVSTYVMPPSRLKMEGVFEFEKGRVDGRNFNPATLAASYPRELYARYNINTVEGRGEFLRSRGFEEFWQPAVAVFDIMPYVLKIIETGSFINEVCDVSIASLSDRDSTDIDNLMYQQKKLEYFKKLDNSSYSNFQKFLFSILDFFIDSQSQK